jgi:hypothetical protein
MNVIVDDFKPIFKRSKEILSSIKDNSFYLRVSADHPLELRLGYDSLGRKTLRLIGKFSKKNVKKTVNIDVQFGNFSENELSLSFSLINEEFKDIFYYFCDDIISSSSVVAEENGLDFILERYETWRVFSNTRSTNLSESQIKGLIGELLFLKESFKLYSSQTEAIAAWTGSEPTKKDFTFKDYWYEIKVTSNSNVSISSLAQLESNFPGYLVVFTMEKISPVSQGISLNTLVDEITSLLGLQSDVTSFIYKLIQAGYFKGDYYDDYKYEVKTSEIFPVDEKFPRITRETLNDHIIEVKYTIELNGLNKSKLGEFKR